MKIKRYTAVSMREALAQVRAEQGPDAVILSSRRGDDGIEVIAAVDYDEALFVDANRQRTAASVIAPAAPVISPAPASIIVPRTATAATPARARAVAAPAAAVAAPLRKPVPAAALPDSGVGAVQRELR